MRVNGRICSRRDFVISVYYNANIKKWTLYTQLTDDIAMPSVDRALLDEVISTFKYSLKTRLYLIREGTKAFYKEISRYENFIIQRTSTTVEFTKLGTPTPVP